MQKQYFYIALVVGICLEYTGSDDTTTPETQDTKISSSSQVLYMCTGNYLTISRVVITSITISIPSSENDEEEIVTDHTFVALIDIVYTDGSKRSCTGAIIDDNVVVTAAHCFVVKSDTGVQPELTASFVVIGTKKMFDTGYEQYLPIERVLTHPKYRGWEADISLVYTFAAMTADKPGTVIALAGDKTSHVEKNVTVFSWGRYGDGDINFSTKSSLAKHQKKNEDSCENSSGNIRDEAGKEYTSFPKPDYVNRGYVDHSYDRLEATDQDSAEHRMRHSVEEIKITKTTLSGVKQRTMEKSKKHSYDRLETTDQDSEENRMRHNVEGIKITKTTLSGVKQRTMEKSKKHSYDRLESTDQDSEENRMRHNVEGIKITKTTLSGVKQRTVEKSKKVISRYLASDDDSNSKAPANYDEEGPKFRTKAERDEPLPVARETLDSYLDSIWNKFTSTQIVTETTTEAEIETYDRSLKSHYKNWRRQMPTQQNSLVVEVFGFITNQVCKKLFEKGMSSNYDNISQQKDFVCYVSEEYPVTDRDSGAPAILHGQLIAVTLGGLQCDEDHVGFGMKIMCFCSWIAENVPNGKNMTCCKNCCGNKRENRINVESESPTRNKYLLR